MAKSTKDELKPSESKKICQFLPLQGLPCVTNDFHNDKFKSIFQSGSQNFKVNNVMSFV